MSIVSVTDLRKSYGKIEAVRGVSFEVAEGEMFGLLVWTLVGYLLAIRCFRFDRS